MDFLQVSGKTFLVTGVANKKSVAFFVAKGLIENGAQVIFPFKMKKIKTERKSFSPTAPF